jgi:hypothetical protein
MAAVLRRAVILPVACLALGAASLIAPTSAWALATACGGDVCFSLNSIYGGFVAWAPNYAFYGHFELQTPQHTVANTSNKQWYVGVKTLFGNQSHSGYYCITAWQLVGTNGYDKIGYTCMTVSIK